MDDHHVPSRLDPGTNDPGDPEFGFGRLLKQWDLPHGQTNPRGFEEG